MDVTLKNLLLAGIGSMACTYEKAEGMVKELVKKGQLAVMDGIELNEELKRDAGKKADEGEQITVGQLRKLLTEMDLATKSDIVKLEKRLENLEKKSDF